MDKGKIICREIQMLKVKGMISGFLQGNNKSINLIVMYHKP